MAKRNPRLLLELDMLKSKGKMQGKDAREGKGDRCTKDESMHAAQRTQQEVQWFVVCCSGKTPKKESLHQQKQQQKQQQLCRLLFLFLLCLLAWPNQAHNGWRGWQYQQ